MNELVKGYPAYLYFGIFEYHFGKVVGEKVVKFLEEDELIKVVKPTKAGEQDKYRVTPKGIDFATSMAQLDYSQETRIFTIVIIVLGGLALLFSFEQLILIYLQNPIF